MHDTQQNSSEHTALPVNPDNSFSSLSESLDCLISVYSRATVIIIKWRPHKLSSPCANRDNQPYPVYGHTHQVPTVLCQNQFAVLTDEDIGNSDVEGATDDNSLLRSSAPMPRPRPRPRRCGGLSTQNSNYRKRGPETFHADDSDENKTKVWDHLWYED